MKIFAYLENKLYLCNVKDEKVDSYANLKIWHLSQPVYVKKYMNIKISKAEFDELNSIVGNKSTHYVIGSKLYGTNGEHSDTDILVMFDGDYPLDVCFPNKHQLQYDDVNNNIQYIITSNRQFYKGCRKTHRSLACWM